MSEFLNRRAFMTGAALSAGAIALIKGSLVPSIAKAQTALSPSRVVSFAAGNVTFHTYVSPPEAVSVTAHVVEFENELLVVDGTFMPPTAEELNALVASTGKPVAKAILSHEHPDHWRGAAAISDWTYDTLADIRAAVVAEGGDETPAAVAQGGDLALGEAMIGSVPVEFRHYESAEAPHQVVTVLPEQKVAIVQDLVYNGVYFAPGVDRANWISTLRGLRDDPAFDTLLVGHGLPTTRGELDTAISYLETLHEVMETAATPDDAIAAMKAAYPSYSGDFLLTLVEPYWPR